MFISGRIDTAFLVTIYARDTGELYLGVVVVVFVVFVLLFFVCVVTIYGRNMGELYLGGFCVSFFFFFFGGHNLWQR